MVYYVYRVEWNNNPETETFEKFDDAKALVDRKAATGDPKYVSPFIYEIELAEDENGIAVPTGNDECVFSWDSQKPENNPDLRQPKLFDDSDLEGEYTEPDFEVYDEFDVTEKVPEPEDPYEGRTLFDYNFDEALSALNEADDQFGECQCCHEEFPKSELIKEGSRYICKECAGSLSEDVAEESLEETVPEDLADDRTPIQGDVHVLDEPVDYKKEIAKEKLVDESLTEDLDQDLQKWNAYVNYLRGQIEQEEKALEKAGDNDLVKAAIQRRIDAFKADLEDALPNLVKKSPDQEEPKDLVADKDDHKKDDHEEDVKESLNEGFDMTELNRLLAAAKKLGLETAGDLDKFSKEHGNVKDKELLKVIEEEAAKLD